MDPKILLPFSEVQAIANTISRAANATASVIILFREANDGSPQVLQVVCGMDEIGKTPMSEVLKISLQAAAQGVSDRIKAEAQKQN